MTGVVEVLNQGKWQTVAFGQPFDSRAGLPRDEVDDCAVRFAVRLALRSAANNAALSRIPSANCQRVPAAGIKPRR
jgi:hypothetical protein